MDDKLKPTLLLFSADSTSCAALSCLTKHIAAVPACTAALQGMYPHTLPVPVCWSLCVSLLLNTGALGAVKQSINIETSHMSLGRTGVSCPMGTALRGPDQRQQAPDSACSPDIRILLVQLHASGPGDGSHRLHHATGHIPGC